MIPIITHVSDMLVLAVLSSGDAYGYQIARTIKPLSNTEKPFSAYPILKRLQKEGLLTTYNKVFQGRNQKFYKITDSGIQQYNTWIKEWNIFKNAVEHILRIV